MTHVDPAACSTCSGKGWTVTTEEADDGPSVKWADCPNCTPDNTKGTT